MTMIRSVTFGAIVFLGVLLTSSQAAEKGKKPPNREAATSAPAAIRLWKDAFPSKRNIRVLLKPTARKGTPTEIRVTSPGYRFMDYVELPAGDFTVEVNDLENLKAGLFQKTVTLPPKSFTTLLLREEGESISAEFIDDTIRGTSAEVGELTVRNFAPTLATLQIRVGDEVNVSLGSPASFLQVRGLKKALVQVETSGADVSGTALKWTSEVDFRTVLKATLVVYPDPYGRIRPQVVVDGENPNSSKEEAPSKTDR